MGIFSDLFGGGKKTHTTTSSFPKHVEDAQKKVYGAADAAMEPWIKDPSYKVAGFNDHHKWAGNDYSHLHNKILKTDHSSHALGQFGRNNDKVGLDYSSGATGLMGRNLGGIGGNFSNPLADMATAGERVLPMAGQYSTINSGDALKLGNPFRVQMLDSMANRLGDAHDTALTRAAGEAASGAGFSGSGAAIRAANADKALMDGMRDATTQINYDSYNTGAQLAGQNQASENAAIGRLTNAGLQSAQMGINALQAADGAQNNFFNRTLGSNQFDANMLGQADNFASSYLGRNLNTTRTDLAALGATEEAENGYVNRSLSGLKGLMDWGDKQQYQKQRENDQNYEQFKRFSQFLPGGGSSYGSTTSQPIYRNNTANTIGTAATLGKMFGLF